MLLTCKQFEVDGAPDTIRKMLPLIFAKDQGARLPGAGQGGGYACAVAQKRRKLTRVHEQKRQLLSCPPSPPCAAIKDRIVEALDQLYINGWAGNVFSSAQAARNLIDLATGATLGAHPALACRRCCHARAARRGCLRCHRRPSTPHPTPPPFPCR